MTIDKVGWLSTEHGVPFRAQSGTSYDGLGAYVAGLPGQPWIVRDTDTDGNILMSDIQFQTIAARHADRGPTLMALSSAMREIGEWMQIGVGDILDGVDISHLRKIPRKLEWTAEYEEAAANEGWMLAECYGSVDGELQIQAIDDLNIRTDDEDAWRVVWADRETKPHCQAALALLLRDNPAEYERIKSFCQPSKRRPSHPRRVSRG